MKIHEQMTCVKQSLFNDNNPMGAEIGPILGEKTRPILGIINIFKSYLVNHDS